MAAIRPEEISSILEKEIQAYQTDLKMESVGVVLTVGDGIARVYGLDQAMAGELIEFPGGIFGMALNLEEDSVGCVVLGSVRGIKEGDVVTAIALGADAVMFGRPYVFGLAVGGEAGAARVLELVTGEIDRVLALLGVASLDGVRGRSDELLVRSARAAGG